VLLDKLGHFRDCPPGNISGATGNHAYSKSRTGKRKYYTVKASLPLAAFSVDGEGCILTKTFLVDGQSKSR
jgi:hypothetical protein